MIPWTISELHPLFIHFPIALFSTGLFFDMLYRIIKNDEFNKVGFWMMLMGLISSFFAILSGFIVFINEADIFDLIQFQHGYTQILICINLLILFIIRIIYELEIKYSIYKQNIFLIVHILSILLLFFSSHLGAIASNRLN
tara:strand:- start:190 stop:612 length:423 start_codon:yes stop_codon:yes gene_type:complete